MVSFTWFNCYSRLYENIFTRRERCCFLKISRQTDKTSLRVFLDNPEAPNLKTSRRPLSPTMMGPAGSTVTCTVSSPPIWNVWRNPWYLKLLKVLKAFLKNCIYLKFRFKFLWYVLWYCEIKHFKSGFQRLFPETAILSLLKLKRRFRWSFHFLMKHWEFIFFTLNEKKKLTIQNLFFRRNLKAI